MEFKINEEQSDRIPEEFRFHGVRDSLPEFCQCVELGLSFNRHRNIRVRNERGLIKFCPKTRFGWIQINSTGVILDGVFRGNISGD